MHPTPRSNRKVAAVVCSALLCAATLIACGGGSDGTTSTSTSLLSLAANQLISLDSCGGTVGAGVPAFYKNYFLCSDRKLSDDGKSVVFTFYGLPPYSSPYYSSSHPNHVSYSADRGLSLLCSTGQTPGVLSGCFTPNPNTITQNTFTLTIPLTPTARGIDVNASAAQIDNTSGDALDYATSVMGVAANGVALFSAFAAPGDDILDEAYTFDSHEGHPQNSGVYHYHAYSPGPLAVMVKQGYNTSTTPGSPSAGGVEFYGITCDGVLLLGATELDGSTPSGTLDAQGGHVHDIVDKSGTKHFSSRYHVHLSPRAIGSNSKAYRFAPELQYYSTCITSTHSG
jgi:hypothetical protein